MERTPPKLIKPIKKTHKRLFRFRPDDYEQFRWMANRYSTDPSTLLEIIINGSKDKMFLKAMDALIVRVNNR